MLTSPAMPGRDEGDSPTHEGWPNRARFAVGDAGGHYESFFVRANHPTEPRAFWIRYTIFSPKGRPRDAIGELWAIVFDGRTNAHVVCKKEFPIALASFARDRFEVKVGEAMLDGRSLVGSVAGDESEIAWNLRYTGVDRPLLLLPRWMYEAPLPRAKALVGAPNATFEGTLTVNGETLDVGRWRGSQNHNWGSKHTDEYAWGQVCGFDDAPDSFLEVATARLKIGPVWTPPMTPIVLRHRGEEFPSSTLRHAVRAHGEFRFFDWRFSSATRELEVEGEISAPKESFVGLRYYNPPGGTKHCLNSKLARCTIRLRRRDGRTETLTSSHRAAFELLTDARDHGVPMRA